MNTEMQHLNICTGFMEPRLWQRSGDTFSSENLRTLPEHRLSHTAWFYTAAAETCEANRNTFPPPSPRHSTVTRDASRPTVLRPFSSSCGTAWQWGPHSGQHSHLIGWCRPCPGEEKVLPLLPLQIEPSNSLQS